jgi:hypothetical protein
MADSSAEPNHGRENVPEPGSLAGVFLPEPFEFSACGGIFLQKQVRCHFWENDPSLFQAWCHDRTGYPIVDAAMRQDDRGEFPNKKTITVTGV